MYLVNTLVPSDRGVRVAAQGRSYDQSRYQLDVDIRGLTQDLASMDVVGSPPPSATPDAPPVLATFFVQGIRHILTGYDHLLFVAALVLGAATLWDLVKVVTAFTIAHSLTLTLATLRLVHLPSTLVEPVIAASIVAVAVQNVLRPDQTRGGSRFALAFVFGLFHGLGFAGGLLEVMHEMSGGTVLLAILGFSVGVDIGNQLVLLPLFAAIRVMERLTSDLRETWVPRIRQLSSMFVAGAGMVYLIDAFAT